MATSILVTYATRHGSTQEVAESITTTLREHGLLVEMHPIGEIQTLNDYRAIVLGAPIYMGRWQLNALKFLMRHRAELTERPVAIFALGPLSVAEKEWCEARQELNKACAKLPWLTPMATELFGGVIDPAKLHFPFNHMPAGDARDWTAIHSWADKLAAMFQPSASRS